MEIGAVFETTMASAMVNLIRPRKAVGSSIRSPGPWSDEHCHKHGIDVCRLKESVMIEERGRK
jgi:hypothetical protein